MKTILWTIVILLLSVFIVLWLRSIWIRIVYFFIVLKMQLHVINIFKGAIERHRREGTLTPEAETSLRLSIRKVRRGIWRYFGIPIGLDEEEQAIKEQEQENQ